ncbi:MAG: DUF3846 domain-containing protein [Oscillibacter sp.]|nr:DUF3846 domain-containing protein [Oscillibacter sp.]
MEIRNTTEELKRHVGETVQTYELAVDACVVYDEEWRLKNRPPSVELCGMEFGGPILIVGFDGEGFTDLPQPEVIKELFWPTQHKK